MTFEKLADQPKTEARDVYDFLNWKSSKNLLKWIEKNTRKNKGDDFSTTRNSKDEISKWRTEIDKEEKFLIDSICKSFLEALNYE